MDPDIWPAFTQAVGERRAISRGQETNLQDWVDILERGWCRV
jgi:hypothetical protein